MTSPTGTDRDCEQAKLLLEEYSFDLSGFQAGELVAIWQERLGAEPNWIRAAILEALYLGRYKAFSVEQILQGWKRRGHPVRHFNSEFERVVFGPIDPTLSKYAQLAATSPSSLMVPSSPTDAIPTTSSSQPISPEPSLADDMPTAPQSPLAKPSVSKAQPEVARPHSPVIEPPTAHTSTAAYASGVYYQPQPIRQFEPQPAATDFYQRLQSVARNAQ